MASSTPDKAQTGQAQTGQAQTGQAQTAPMVEASFLTG
jgi:hypothetical protein